MNLRKAIVLTAILCVMTLGVLLPNQAAFAESKKDNEQSKKELIESIMTYAKNGKVINSEFGIGEKSETIIKKWGPPQNSRPNVLYYMEQRKVFFYLEDDYVCKIHSNDASFGQLYMDDIEDFLGEPLDEGIDPYWGDTYYLIYEAGDFYLRFDILPFTEILTKPVHSVSVFKKEGK